MKIAIIGGHLAPALSIIDQLPKNEKIVFFGRKHTFEGDSAESLEYKEITKRGIPFIHIITGRLQRKITKYTIFSLLKFPVGFTKAFAALKKVKPDIIISFGGYVSIPVCLAASVMKIPIVLHEQTLAAGLANKFLAKFAAKICISWEDSRSFFPAKKVILTGLPLKATKTPILAKEVFFEKYDLPSSDDLPLLYITGGSTGAHMLNMLVEGCLTHLLERCRIIHQTGDATAYQDFGKLDTLRKTLDRKLQERYVVTKFINPEHVRSIMHFATLVVSRSGMNTVFELIFMKKPALLVPIKTGQRNEQYTNAKFMERIGLAEIFDQEKGSESFFLAIETMIKNSKKYTIKDDKINRIPKDATEKLIEVIYEIATQKTHQTEAS